MFEEAVQSPRGWWDVIREAARACLGDPVYDRWFRDAVVVEETESAVVLRVPSRHQAFMLTQIYGDDIRRMSREAGLPQKTLRCVWPEAERPAGAAPREAAPAEPADAETVAPGPGAAAWKPNWPEFVGRRLPAHAYTSWLRPTAVIAEDEASVTILVPTPYHARVIEQRYARLIAEAAREAGLPEKTLRFVVPKTEEPARPGGRELIRQELVGRKLITQDEAESLIQAARAAGVDPDRLGRELYQKVLRFWRRTHPEAFPDFDLYAVGVSLIRQMAGQTTVVEPAVRPDRAAVFLTILRHPALLISPKRVVSILIEVEPGRRFEIRREGTRGMSPQTAAVFLAGVSLAIEGSRIRRGSPTGLPVLLVEKKFIEDILGRPIDDRDVRRLGQSLRCAFNLALWRPGRTYETLDDFRLFRGVGWEADRRFIHFVLDPHDLERLRGLNRRYDFRFVRSGAIPALAGAPRLAAALTLWLAGRWHGRQGTRHPVDTTLDDLHRDLLGAAAPKDRKNRWRSWKELLAAVEWVNRNDALAKYGIEPPRRVHLERLPGWVLRFRRTTGPVIDVEPVGLSTDPFEAWLRVRTVRAGRSETPARALYEDYVRFCRRRGARPLSRPAWGRRMGERFRRAKRKVSGRAVWVWQGLKLR